VQVANFVTELIAEGLVVEASDRERGELPALDVGDGRLDVPLIEKFTDMEDLLLLDPVHDVDARGWPHAAPGS
jgi:hypothetical protein